MTVHQELIPRVSVEGAVYPSLKGKGVLITGGGSGIGASLVEHFCAQGARVGFIELNPDYAEETAAAYRSRNRQPAALRGGGSSRHRGASLCHRRALGADRARSGSWSTMPATTTGCRSRT